MPDSISQRPRARTEPPEKLERLQLSNVDPAASATKAAVPTPLSYAELTTGIMPRLSALCANRKVRKMPPTSIDLSTTARA